MSGCVHLKPHSFFEYKHVRTFSGVWGNRDLRHTHVEICWHLPIFCTLECGSKYDEYSWLQSRYSTSLWFGREIPWKNVQDVLTPIRGVNTKKMYIYIYFKCSFSVLKMRIDLNQNYVRQREPKSGHSFHFRSCKTWKWFTIALNSKGKYARHACWKFVQGPKTKNIKATIDSQVDFLEDRFISTAKVLTQIKGFPTSNENDSCLANPMDLKAQNFETYPRLHISWKHMKVIWKLGHLLPKKLRKNFWKTTIKLHLCP